MVSEANIASIWVKCNFFCAKSELEDTAFNSSKTLQNLPQPLFVINCLLLLMNTGGETQSAGINSTNDVE